MAEITENWNEFLGREVSRHRALVCGVKDYVARLGEKGLPVIFEFLDLANVLGIHENILSNMLKNPTPYYHEFRIQKRSGGSREISSPSPVLRQAQLWILDQILSKVPLHEAAHGFVPGRSIVTNARMHLNAACVLKIDIKDFFPSVSIRRGVATFMRCGYPKNVSYYLASLCFLEGGLPQGAPTSPCMSNIVAKRLDARLCALAKNAGLTYTRYADDLAFSGNQISLGFLKKCQEIIEDEGFIPNNKKTRLIRGNGKKVIAGVSVAGERLHLPKAFVRKIKSDVYNLWRDGYWGYMEKMEEFDPIYIERLRGRVGFWRAVDPEHKAIGRMEAMLDEVEAGIQNGIDDLSGGVLT